MEAVRKKHGPKTRDIIGGLLRKPTGALVNSQYLYCHVNTACRMLKGGKLDILGALRTAVCSRTAVSVQTQSGHVMRHIPSHFAAEYRIGLPFTEVSTLPRATTLPPRAQHTQHPPATPLDTP